MEFGFGARSGNHSPIMRAHLISLGGERRLASEKEAARSVGNSFASLLRIGSGSPREGEPSMLSQNGGLTSEVLGP